MMKLIGNILAGICAVIFVISSVIAITFFNIEQKAFSSETYKTAFKEQGLYTAAPTIFANMIISSTESSSESSPLLSVLNKDEMEFVITALLPPDELELLMNEAFDSFFNYLNGDADTISISLLPFKQHLASEGGVQAFTQIILTQPECTAEQALQITLGFLSSGEGLILCRPPQEAMGIVTPIIESQLQSLTLNFPDNLILRDDSQQGLSDFRTRLDRVRAAMKLTPAFPLLMLLALTIFAVRSLNGWLRWWGIPFIITGIVSALLAMIGTPIIRLFVDNVILQGNANMPVIFLDMMRNVTGALVKQLLKPIAVEGIILALIGTGMLVAAGLLNKKSQTKTAKI